VLTARIARLATIDPDGRPHLVPIVFVLDGETGASRGTDVNRRCEDPNVLSPQTTQAAAA
jgi:nitroimidazol reductase NimA-like FMN-containing flavoprotein (pyridoxamine 5'-phosphate oxidase superfamily)